MSETILRIENLGKKFFLGHQTNGNLRQTFVQSVKAWLRPDSHANEEFWALKNFDLEVRRGDVVGIIGRNGAGKSTLLKILSRITYPTTGRFEIDGRVSSLLEVGTGFHGELTGRENIFLNGTILGMRRGEVRKKFDEIVAFSGVENFLDTPVKHYSSGMRVRLAFSVAAHLEPEVLIIDEVLAVGDAEFQRKCLGKMDEVSRKEGRTVLFVSHNLGAVEGLCNCGVLMDNAQIKYAGRIDAVIKEYLKQSSKDHQLADGVWDFSGEFLKRLELKSDGTTTSQIVSGKKFVIAVHFKNGLTLDDLVLGIAISTKEGQTICAINNRNTGQKLVCKKSEEVITVTVPAMTLYQGREYLLDLFLGDRNEDIETIRGVVHFSVLPGDVYHTGAMLKENRNLIFMPGIKFEIS